MRGMKVYAQFDTIDEAENAARDLRQRCEGIKAVKIRYREVGTVAPDLPVSSFALFDSGDYSAGAGGAHGLAESFSPAVYFDSDFTDIPTREMLDGPRGRVDCSMDVAVEDYSADSVAHVLRSAHGRKVSILG